MIASKKSPNQPENVAFLDEPLPEALRKAWGTPMPDKSFAATVVELSMRERASEQRPLTARVRPIALGVVLAAASAAAAFLPEPQIQLGRDALPPSRVHRSWSAPMVHSLAPAGFAERERQAPLRAAPQQAKSRPKNLKEPQAHYPLCGCSSGAIVCSCVEP